MNMLNYLFLLMFIGISSFAQDSYLIDFSGSDELENNITIMGPDFGKRPLGKVSYGIIPTDSTFPEATDGRGMILSANPGEGVLLMTAQIPSKDCALLRCSVRSSSPHVSIYLASIDIGEKTYVSTITPNNASSFVGQYDRISDFFIPPSSGYQGILQIINLSTTQPVTVYVDNFEIVELGSERIEIDVAELIARSPIPQTGDVVRVDIDGLPRDAKPLEMVYIEPGSFWMGTDNDPKSSGGSDEDPMHEVTLSRGFYVSKYEITQAQWSTIMGDNPSPGYNIGINKPVSQVTWYNAVRFCNRLSNIKSLQEVFREGGNWSANLSKDGYRLLTEAEWEYACRAGTRTRFYWGDDPFGQEIEDHAWYTGNYSSSGPRDVGLKLPNNWGLFDMSGNVKEWCIDLFHWDYYEYSPVNDPLNTEYSIGSENRVLRGGDYNGSFLYCRSTNRESLSPGLDRTGNGFRVARTYIP